jgi:hypothetical protein
LPWHSMKLRTRSFCFWPMVLQHAVHADKVDGNRGHVI